MPKGLLIVESPTKIKTIGKYLGSGFSILASVGHVKDLPKNKLGIDVENGFLPAYEVIEAKKKTMSALKKAAREATDIYLAPDPDREGEAIAWHIAEEIKGTGKNIHRVLFNDLTKETILNAIKNPGPLDFNKYEAQQTRRILDRLVGYKISPLLWEKVQRGLSAGRVQSVAVRLICDREDEIRAFIPEEYWIITANLEAAAPPAFPAKLYKIDGKKTRVATAAHAGEIRACLEKAAFSVKNLDRREVKKSPSPPFTTSKLQQEASRRFSFPPAKTMKVAQQLYEGVDLGDEGSVGLITYMRTDSLRLAEEAIRSIREAVRGQFGNDYLPAKARHFKNREAAQDAHEAIRPTNITWKPADIKAHLSRDQFKIYQLIWNRTVACQMAAAIYDQTTVDVAAENYLFRAQGQILKFPGYQALFSDLQDEDANGASGREVLPELTAGQVLNLLSLTGEQKFTQPPPRFTEASLIRELEEKGIGRPSTYAAILSTIQDRGYVQLENTRFHPTELGGTVNGLMKESFPQIMDVAFTANMEQKLDLIAEGNGERLQTLTEFYQGFASDLEGAKKKMRDIKKEVTPTGELCDICGHPLVFKRGRFGQFIACSHYPKCKNRKNIPSAGEENREAPRKTDRVCDKCGRPMEIKRGRFGEFLGCSGYPECRQVLAMGTGVPCPQEGCAGEMLTKRTKTGKTFFSCSRYPDCTFALWNEPVASACPQCQSPYLVKKIRRDGSGYLGCPSRQCKYKAPLAPESR